MSQATTVLTQEKWHNDGPQTPAQDLLAAYLKAVDDAEYNRGSGRRFYSQDVTFHNQNNVDYHGEVQMWAWMKQIFAQFGKLRHDVLHLVESPGPNQSSFLSVQVTRSIWMLGNDKATPDVSAPLALFCKVGAADDPEAIRGLQMKEVWIYWDTALLAPFLSQDAVVFRKSNPFES